MFLVIRMKNFLYLFAFVSCLSLCAALAVYNPDQVVAAEQNVLPAPKNVLIIDPGHGGLDGGAVGIDGTIESTINLDIGLKMRDLALLFGKNAVMTRDSEQLAYPDENAGIAAKKISDQKARVGLINSFDGAQLISIHQNTYTSPNIHGAQVFFRRDDKSKAMAEKIQAALNSKLISSGRRVASPVSEDIYIMKNINCPAVLVECGFLSNADECARLGDSTYRTKLAMTIFSAWLVEN